MTARIFTGETVAIFVDVQYLRNGLQATIPGAYVDYQKLIVKMATPGNLGRAWFYTAPPPEYMDRNGYDRWVKGVGNLPFCEVVEGKMKKRQRKVRMLRTRQLEEAIYYEQKGVDVKLAIDMIGQVYSYNVAILVAGDGDFVGLAKLVRQNNRHIINAHCPANPEFHHYYSKQLEEACDRPPIILDKDYLQNCFMDSQGTSDHA